MTLFQPSAADPGHPQPAASTSRPRQRRTDRRYDTAGASPATAPDPLPDPADHPTVPGLVERLAGTLADALGTAPDEAEDLARQLHERIVARIAWCRESVLSGRTDGLQRDQLARLRAIAAAPERLAPQMAPELDQPALLALLSLPMPGQAVFPIAARLAERSGHLPPSLAEAVLDALRSPAVLDRFDHRCRMEITRSLVEALPALAMAGEALDAARRSLVPDDADPPDAAAQGRLGGEALLLEALRRGDERGAMEVLATAALVPVASVEMAIALRSRRGMVSLAWKAGYSMRAAILMQSQLAGIPPDQALLASTDGGCPLSRNEMLWQIGFLARGLG